MPDAGAGETIDSYGEVVGTAGLGIEEFAGLGSVDHALGGTLADTFRIAVTPDLGGENGFVPLVNEITDGLADQMVGD